MSHKRKTLNAVLFLLKRRKLRKRKEKCLKNFINCFLRETLSNIITRDQKGKSVVLVTDSQNFSICYYKLFQEIVQSGKEKVSFFIFLGNSSRVNWRISMKIDRIIQLRFISMENICIKHFCYEFLCEELSKVEESSHYFLRKFMILTVLIKINWRFCNFSFFSNIPRWILQKCLSKPPKNLSLNIL